MLIKKKNTKMKNIKKKLKLSLKQLYSLKIKKILIKQLCKTKKKNILKITNIISKTIM